MITDIFLRRYPEYEVAFQNSFFVQLFNIYDDHHIGIHGTLLDKIQDYPYSSYADEHIRIIAQSQKKLCNELGCPDLNKPEYKQPDWGYPDYRIFKNYVFDESINPLEKISFFEILFRDTEKHILSEIEFIETNIPTYEARSAQIKAKGANYHDDGEEKLKKALPQLERKKLALGNMRTGIEQRLKLHKTELAYHNGHFQKSADPAIELTIAVPSWSLMSDPKYKNVETDMLEALDRYDSGDRDPAFYAAKALESMIKIICEEKGYTIGNEKGAADYLSHLNSSKNGTIIINDEKEELLSMFRIRNTHGGHGAGSKPMPTLTNTQALRYIHSAMVWISNLAKR